MIRTLVVGEISIGGNNVVVADLKAYDVQIDPPPRAASRRCTVLSLETVRTCSSVLLTEGVPRMQVARKTPPEGHPSLLMTITGRAVSSQCDFARQSTYHYTLVAELPSDFEVFLTITGDSGDLTDFGRYLGWMLHIKRKI